MIIATRLALIIAFLFLLCNYSLSHPIDLSVFSNTQLWLPSLLQGFKGLSTAILILWIFEKIGAGVCSIITKSSKHPPTVQAAAGITWIITASTALLFYGIFGLYSSVLVWLPILWGFKDFSPQKPWSLLSALSWSQVLFLATIVLVWGSTALPFSTAYDDHFYHLEFVRQFSNNGSIWEATDVTNSFRPFAHGALFSWVNLPASLVFPGIAGVSTITGFVNIALILLTCMILCQAKATTGWAAMLVFLSNPQFARLAETFYADPLLCLAVVMILSITGSEYLFLRGFLAGLLPAIKYNGLYLCPFAIPFILATSGENPLKTNIKTLFAGIILAVFLCSTPFIIRNYRAVHNPLYPHLSGIFTSSHYQRSEILEQLPEGRFYFPPPSKYLLDAFGMGHDTLNLILAPWNVTVHSHFNTPDKSLRHFDGQLGMAPLVAVFAGIVVLITAATPQLFALFTFTLLTWVFWLAGSHMIRHMLPVVAAASLLPVYFQGKQSRFLLGLVIAAGVVSMLWTTHVSLARFDETVPFLTGSISEDEFMKFRSIPVDAFAWMNQNLGTDTLTLTLLEERTWLLQTPYIWTGIAPSWLMNFVVRAGTTEIASSQLEKHRITHVLLPIYGLNICINAVEDPDYQAVVLELFRRWKIVFQSNSHIVFEVQ